MLERILIAGSGGQGILLAGKIVAATAMERVAHVTFFPAYGAEVRGGTSHCRVILASEQIASPVADELDWMLIMNQASLDRFLPQRGPRTAVIVNASLCRVDSQPDVVSVAATEEGEALGDIRAANLVMLGALAARCEPWRECDIVGGIRRVLAALAAALVEVNVTAFERGLTLGAVPPA